MYLDVIAHNNSLIETATANNNSASASAKDLYRSKMQELFEESKPLLDEKELRAEHEKNTQEALKKFQQQPNKGGEAFSEPFKAILEQVRTNT